MGYIRAVAVVIFFCCIPACSSISQNPDIIRANRLEQEAKELYRSGSYAEAVPMVKEVLLIREETLGPDHQDVAQSLNSLARLYDYMGDYAKAEPLYRRSLSIREKTFDSEHPSIGQSLNNLALLYYMMGDYGQAETLYRRALVVAEKGPEKYVGNMATTLSNLGMLYRTMGRYAQAERCYKRSLAIREKTFGPDHPSVGGSVHNLALLYRVTGDYHQSENLYKRSLTITEKALGPDHPDTAQTLNSLGGLYQEMGDYVRAEPMYKRSLAIRERVLGPKHPDVANSLNSLGTLYQHMGDYAKAEELYERVLALWEQALGPDHPDVAPCLNNLAVLYKEIGDYARAEQLYKRSLAITEQAFGPDHPSVGTSLNNQANFYLTMGDYRRAEVLFKRSLSIGEKAFGPDHPRVGVCLNNLAVIYKNRRDYDQAESLYNRSLAITEKAFGADHPSLATNLNNLAGLYRDNGKYEQAELLLKRSLAIGEKAFGSDHPDVGMRLNNLAEIYRDMGDDTRAEPLYKRTLAITEKAFGPDHPSVCTTLNSQAWLYASRGEFLRAHHLYVRSQAIDEKLIDQITGFTSEARQMAFLSTRRPAFDAAIGLAVIHLADDAAVREDALDMWLRRKGVLLEAQTRFQEALVHSDTSGEAQAVFQELSRVRHLLSEMTFGNPPEREFQAYREKLARLNANKEELEARLAGLCKGYASKKRLGSVDTDRVAMALPEQSALIEFLQFKAPNFGAAPKERRWLPARYAAFVLLAGKGGSLSMIDLGDAKEIDRLVTELKTAITGMPDSRGRQAAADASRKLYDRVFAPLHGALGEVKEVFLSPDGNLNLIPFEILRGPEGKYLIEDYTFNYLAAGRDILGFGQATEQSGKALIIGDPDFDLEGERKAGMVRELSLAKPYDVPGARRAVDMRGLRFNRLPWTREEVEAIGALLGDKTAEVYEGPEALEELLMKKTNPHILHLATHGFFLRDRDMDGFFDNRGFERHNGFPKAGVNAQNPLLRSGIALAGANTSLKSEGMEKSSGLVTAEKILGLRLWGTDMVVLSACETGLGQVKAGEGVYGLRRAFVQAGAKSLIMSMWSVPDRETQELMITFYKNIQSGKLNKCQALRAAVLKQMEIVRQRYGYAHPLYWGAFVFLGEP